VVDESWGHRDVASAVAAAYNAGSCNEPSRIPAGDLRAQSGALMRTAFLIAAACLLSACGGDTGSSPDVLTLTLTAPKQTIAVGEPVQITATARDVNGVTLPSVSVTYTSSAPAVASVNATGRVIGVSQGSANITAKTGVATAQPLSFNVTAGNVAAVFTMQANTFTPAQATIRVGQSVLFDFPADVHNVIFQQRTGKPADIATTSGQAVTRAFTTAGTFPFDCTLHPGMSGTVIVNP
jgi:plastocyanin